MATVKYYLKDKNAKEKSSILLYLMIHDKIIKVSSRESIHPKFWDFDKQVVKRNFTGSVELNSLLKEFSVEVLDAYRKLRREKKPISSTTIKDIVFEYEKKEKTIWIRFDEFLAVKSHDCSPNTIKKYQALKNHLEDYESLKGTLDFDKFNLSFYDHFTGYLIDNKKLTNNTVGKYIQGLKTFLSWCYDRKYHSNDDFRRYKKITEKTDIVYLTEKELYKIIKLDLPFQSKLSNVRDVFLFGCYTGQRFSDILAIKREQIKDGTWYIRVQKTKDVLEVPLSNRASEILGKYEEELKPLPVISNQKMNDYLKVLCEKAKLNESIVTTRYQGNKRIEFVNPKHQLVTTHTARRTFVTLSLEKGMRPETVMEITGHKDYSIFKKYIKITSKVKQQEMQNIWG